MLIFDVPLLHVELPFRSRDTTTLLAQCLHRTQDIEFLLSSRVVRGHLVLLLNVPKDGRNLKTNELKD
jgi:hypothetical protein